MTYRTQDGLADYGFSIEFFPDIGWRIYIVFAPEGEGENPRFPYQSTDDNGRDFVAWSGRIENLGEAKVVAELWAELTRCYQRLGAQATDQQSTTEEPDTEPHSRTSAA